MHAISSYRGNRRTNKHSHKPTDRTDYNILCRSLARSVMTQVHPVTQASTSRDEIVRSEQQTRRLQSSLQWNEYWTNTSSIISSRRNYKCDVLSLGLGRNDLYNTVTPFMFTSSLFRDFHAVNKECKIKVVNNKINNCTSTAEGKSQK